ncbi:MAG: PEP-CTERM sorting domain-containing protein [Planctomycetota bacterium]|nr:PEP-CTERM sorting domain-containing protein [Planctomycetota bacterium]
MRTWSVRAAAAAVCALAGLAQASVSDYSNFKSRYTTQTGAGVLEAYVYQGIHRVVGGPSLNPTTAGDVKVTLPGGQERTLGLLFDGYFVAGAGGFTSEAALDGWMPAGDYTFSLTGGTLGDSSGTVSVPEVNLWASAPMIMNWNDVQSAQANTALVVDVAEAVVDPSINDGGFFWTVRNLTAGTAFSSFQSFGDPSQFEIDGALLIAGHEYLLELYYAARIPNGVADGVLSEGVGFTSFDTVVEARFTVVPAPGAMGLLGAGLLAAARRRRAN